MIPPIIECSDVSKTFRLYGRENSLKRLFVSRVLGSRERKEWYVLQHLDFVVRRGERVAVIGKNGSGKSTLLRLLCGIYRPTSGSIAVSTGRVLALIELGVGFYPELTGRQNIRLNWALNGVPIAELKSKFDQIVDFSGIEEFLDTPVKYYSSGMKARLGFAVAIHADPELLIIDEVLAVGDAQFQNLCHDRIDSLCRNGTTLVLVSHDLGLVQRMCSRSIWLTGGTVGFDGSSAEAARRYMANASPDVIPQ